MIFLCMFIGHQQIVLRLGFTFSLVLLCCFPSLLFFLFLHSFSFRYSESIPPRSHSCDLVFLSNYTITIPVQFSFGIVTQMEHHNGFWIQYISSGFLSQSESKFTCCSFFSLQKIIEKFNSSITLPQAQFVKSTAKRHWEAIKHALGYIKAWGCQSTSLEPSTSDIQMLMWVDTNWDGEFSHSTQGSVKKIFFFPILRASKRQVSCTTSTCHSKFMVLVNKGMYLQGFWYAERIILFVSYVYETWGIQWICQVLSLC
ncbi:uncharacterized protein VP01_5812g1 [Puccinia sorghi]|uniref:Uncharacterized protein n=1 Tax=Puccinia sorghi TaxID=27349 RepID=A0A0L6UI61_9BASI|nr:uncharacterized protein VP01_5812g1 [Puccinia sorghi]